MLDNTSLTEDDDDEEGDDDDDDIDLSAEEFDKVDYQSFVFLSSNSEFVF